MAERPSKDDMDLVERWVNQSKEFAQRFGLELAPMAAAVDRLLLYARECLRLEETSTANQPVFWDASGQPSGHPYTSGPEMVKVRPAVDAEGEQSRHPSQPTASGSEEESTGPSADHAKLREVAERLKAARMAYASGPMTAAFELAGWAALNKAYAEYKDALAADTVLSLLDENERLRTEAGDLKRNTELIVLSHKADLADRASEAERLRQELDKWKRKAEEHEGQLVRIANAFGKDARHAPNSDATIAGMTIAEHDRQAARIRELEAENERLRRERDDAEGENPSVADRSDHAKLREAAAIREAAERLANGVLSLLDENERLRKLADQRLLDRQEMKNKCHELLQIEQARIRELGAENERLRTTRAECERQYQAMVEEVGRLQDRIRELEDQRDTALTQRDEFKRIGQQFERDARDHFYQSCLNLQRAEAAEDQLAARPAVDVEAVMGMVRSRDNAILQLQICHPDQEAKAQAECDRLLAEIRKALTWIKSEPKNSPASAASDTGGTEPAPPG